MHHYSKLMLSVLNPLNFLFRKIIIFIINQRLLSSSSSSLYICIRLFYLFSCIFLLFSFDFSFNFKSWWNSTSWKQQTNACLNSVFVILRSFPYFLYYIMIMVIITIIIVMIIIISLLLFRESLLFISLSVLLCTQSFSPLHFPTKCKALM